MNVVSNSCFSLRILLVYILYILPNSTFNSRIIERRNQLLSEIKEVRRTRALQRASRKRHGGSDGQDMATIAVVGYTNAVGGDFFLCFVLVLLLKTTLVFFVSLQGKSTLVSALSDTYLYSDDR